MQQERMNFEANKRVKKKQVPIGQTSNVAVPTLINQSSQQILRKGITPLEDFQNTSITRMKIDQNQHQQSLFENRSFSHIRNGSSTADTLNPTPLPQMINISQSFNNNSKNNSFNNTLNTTQKHVGFNLQNQSLNNSTQKLSIEQVEENRQLNSKREFQIRKPKKKSKERALNSPSAYTNCAKSMVSMFSSKSGKTTHSAPTGQIHSLSESPQHNKIKIKKKLTGSKEKIVKSKKKLRPFSSTSPNQFYKTLNQKNSFSMTGINFKKKNESQSKERNNSQSNKKVISLKQIKFPNKKYTNSSLLPKPPLHKKQNLLDDHNNSNNNTEILLRIADENLASIEQDLSQVKKQKKGTNFEKYSRNDMKESQKNIQQEAIQKKKQEIQTNFNLSFNNSFNNSYNNQDSPQVLAFSSSPLNSKLGEQQVPQFQGFFTADAIYLEKQLTTRLKEASNNEGKKMQAFNYTFNEIIKRDKNFGSLLLKIKQAYDEYLKKSMFSQQNSPVTRPTYEELLNKVERQEIDIQNQNQKNDELINQINIIKNELDENRKLVDVLTQENEKLLVGQPSESFKLSNVQVVTGNDTIKSLQFSNSSNRTGMQGLTQMHVASSSQSLPNISKKQMVKDLNILASQNVELNSICQGLQDELNYLKLRDKKIMYLIYILQNKGYPVNQIFEGEVKPIPTLRFQEFLDSNPALAEQILGEQEDDTKCLFSFRSNDSYELMVNGPALKRKRPAFVPELNLEGLPEYESSSSEGEAEPQQMNQNPQYYQESLKYIENFYNKYASNNNLAQSNNSIEIGSQAHQTSSQDCLSREEEDDEIREEFDNC